MNDIEENRLIEEIASVGDLKIEVWSDDYQHALEGHPEVTIERVREALRNPIEVVQSKHSGVACLFYSLEFEDEGSGEKIYFCVVVASRSAGRGKLETAYETTYIKTGKSLYKRGK